MEDIAPSLLKGIQEDFQENFDKSKLIRQLYEKVRDGTATYKEANDFALEAGEILANAYKNNLSADVMPDGRMYYNIAQRILSPTLGNNYFLITEVTTQVQKALNDDANLGIKPVIPELNKNRIDGIINRVSDADNFDDIDWILYEPVKNFCQSIVDDAIRENAEFHAKAGLQPKIVRKLVGGCCEWCRALAGTYSYPDVPQDVYRRHQRCRCTVDYHPGVGKVQNVHSKQWHNVSESDKIETRKYIGIRVSDEETPTEKERRIQRENGLDFADRIATHPKMLSAYTPKGLKASLEKAGYDVKPMSSGNLKGIKFENGGGYKVNFGGDGIIMYHPEKRSHHGGAYYKISTGKGGIHRYDTKGNEIAKERDS